MGGVTNRQFKSIVCAHCGKPFSTYDKPGQSGGPDQVPYVHGGLISAFDENDQEVYYHGYVGQSNTCFGRAHPDLNRR